MVLHEIEEALGNFVLENGEVDLLNQETLENIQKRETNRGRLFNKESIRNIVESTYLEEIFSFAFDISNDTSSTDALKYLYSLFHNLEIHEVRNAISHPNRPFWDCYWYRVATIASDPINRALGLQSIEKALLMAEEGRITDPPVEWVRKIIWELPNNLPKQFDHDVTGLIGRSKEIKKLKNLLMTPRVHTIAIVAPGGMGKSAIALDLLGNIIHSPKYTKFVDAVLFVSMKTEKLTSKGLVQLDSIETISELKKKITFSVNQLFDNELLNFKEVIEKFSAAKILLCIDNLETVLRDDQECFEDFNLLLPPTWRILITSRVSVSNATTQSISSLKENSAINLAKKYYAKKGGKGIDESIFEKLASGCLYNPLAIRLTIDFFLAGHAIPSSVTKANKEIAEFSYNNLINTLSQNTVETLEAIFVEGESTRFSLCSLLGKNADEISSAISELSKTSLITRHSSDKGEIYKLSDSVKELLLISPRNIAVRNLVQNTIQKRRQLSKEIDIKQEKLEIPDWHPNYIPTCTDENLKILITEVNRNIRLARKQPSKAVLLLKKIKESELIFKDFSLFQLAYGRVLESLKDYRTAESKYRLAITLDPAAPAPPFLLAKMLFEEKDYEKSSHEYLKLVDMGYTSNNSFVEEFGKKILKELLPALIYSGKLDSALEMTNNWKNAGAYGGIMGAFRARSFIKKMEHIVDSNPRECVECLFSAKKIFEHVVETEGYFRILNAQLHKAFNEIAFCFSKPLFINKFKKEGIHLFEFSKKHLFEIQQTDDHYCVLESALALASSNLPNNPIDRSFLESIHVNLQEDTPKQTRSPENGTIEVEITNLPQNPNYLFASDTFGTEYFLHYKQFHPNNWDTWIGLELGDTLCIEPEFPTKNTQRARNAKKVHIKQV